MRVIPAIDLRDGACVQLVGGSYADERVRIEDAPSVADNWARLGFDRIHLVDLDAATRRGSNREIVRTILGARKLEVQCGGGVRDLDTIGELLAAGASQVVLGTRAVEDRAWLEEAVATYPNRIIVAADTKGRHLATHDWAEDDSQNVIEFVDDRQMRLLLTGEHDGDVRILEWAKKHRYAIALDGQWVPLICHRESGAAGRGDPSRIPWIASAPCSSQRQEWQTHPPPNERVAFRA